MAKIWFFTAFSLMIHDTFFLMWSLHPFEQKWDVVSADARWLIWQIVVCFRWTDWEYSPRVLLHSLVICFRFSSLTICFELEWLRCCWCLSSNRGRPQTAFVLLLKLQVFEVKVRFRISCWHPGITMHHKRKKTANVWTSGDLRVSLTAP